MNDDVESQGFKKISPVVIGVISLNYSNPFRSIMLKTDIQERIEAVVSNGLGVDMQFRFNLDSVDDMDYVDNHLLRMDNDSLAASIKFPESVGAPPRFIEGSEGRNRYIEAPLSRFFMISNFKPEGLDFVGTYNAEPRRYNNPIGLGGIDLVPRKYMGEQFK